MIPIELSHSVLPASAPPTDLAASSTTMFWFVEAISTPAASRAWTVNRLNPGESVCVFDQVPCAASNAALSPFTATRTELGMVLLPTSSATFVFKMAKKTPPADGEPAATRDPRAVYSRTQRSHEQHRFVPDC